MDRLSVSDVLFVRKFLRSLMKQKSFKRPTEKTGLLAGATSVFFSCLFLCMTAPSAQGQTVQFVDVTKAVGIDFVHHSGISEEKRLPETDGSGAAFFDYDGDGDLDLYLVNSGDLISGRGQWKNALYQNEEGHFSDVTDRTNSTGGAAYGMGVVAADYDSDGDADLYLTNWGPDLLYRNDGSVFTDQTDASGLANDAWGSSAAFFDYDNDGDLDLFVVNYVDFTLETHKWCGHEALGLRFYCDTRQHNPTPDWLFRNEGDGTFTEVGQESGITSRGNGLGVVCWDYDGDGDQDVYVANDMEPNFLYENRGGGKFDEIGLISGMALSADGASQAGMGVDTGDYDADGDLDLIVTNYQLENNALYRNDGMVFTEASFQVGLGEISLNYLGFGTLFLDVDNDGWLDLFVANGHVHDNIELYDKLVTYEQKAQLFLNREGTFSEITAQAGPAFDATYVGRGVAYGDYDDDGDLDIVMNNSEQPAVLMRNDGGNSSNWLQIELQGTVSNRDAAGAVVYVESEGWTRMQQVKLGSGYQSSSQKTLFFGLGQRDSVDRIRVVWPSGIQQDVRGIKANQKILLVEDE